VTGSIEAGGSEREHALGPEHLAGCISLSRAASWNQNEADWRLMLELGRGRGLTLADGTLAASTIVLPYGGAFAWVSMVLVLPAHRRKGYAARLLRGALAASVKSGFTLVLDATPAGRAVYAREGFRDCWGFARLALDRPGHAVQAPDGGVRPLQPVDWPRLHALDAPAFGADRERVLRSLAARLPEAALVCERGGRIEGFLLGRDGREACQLGPLVARNARTARSLLAAALARVAAPLYIDVVDREPALRGWLEARGFAFQRPFTRMVYGAARAPGDERLVYCPAGPELG
jgi:GNAT superfamily N-acetyltransferase